MNNKSEKRKLDNMYSLVRRTIALCLFFYSAVNFAQTTNPKMTFGVDKDSILIGDQLNLVINLEVNKTDQVIFPEGQTFAPLEMVESFVPDTLRENDKITLIKKYALTQFDSGAYMIPPQKVLINEKIFTTDSVRIAVNTVPVDTIAQQLFDIKDIIAVEKSSTFPWFWVLILLVGLGIITAFLYFFVWRKKKLTEDEKVALLPPYDRAMLELKKLENSKYLIQDEYKQYYSELTGIVRSYLEEDVHVSALESTTDQLIEKLEMLKDAGNLKLDNETINQFKKILQTSDLVKFAKSKPEAAVAEQDRKAIETIVTKTKEAIPPPTEEELLQQEEYLEELARKKHRKKVIITIVTAVAIFILSLVSAIGYFGFQHVKDTVLGHPTKELLESDWITSSYGYPPVIIETPKVLLRQEVPLTPELKAVIKNVQAFGYRSSIGLFTIGVSSTTLTQEVEPDVQQSIDFIIKSFENQGAKNIITKTEEFTTISGVKGVKTYGSGKFSIPESKELINGNYTILTFGGKGFQQQVIMSWLENDTYAQKIVARVLSTVDVKTE